MLLSIFEWLTQCLAGLLDLILGLFIKGLNLELSTYLDAFPILGRVYDLLQIISLGLTAMIAAVSFFNFFFFKAVDGKYVERPAMILFKTAVASGLIYYGGYILERAVIIASWSFKMFSGLSGMEGGELSGLLGFDSIAEATAAVFLTGTVTELGLITLALLLVALVSYNIFKLALEVAERYLLVGVLVFTSPLAYCSLVSASTSDIFRRWVRMVFSSCIMMSFSALFLKLIVSGLYAVEVGANYFLQIILVLAMCKIAQRIDSYLNQLGLTTAVTGANMLEDIGAMSGLFRTVSGAAGRILGGRANTSTVLGSNGGASGRGAAAGAVPNVHAGGAAAAVINGLRNGRETFVNGGSVGEAFQTGAAAAKETMKRTTIGGAVAGAAESGRNGENKAVGALHGAAVGTGQKVAPVFAGNALNERRANVQERGRQQDAENAQAHTEARDRAIHVSGQPVPEKVSESLHSDRTKPVSASQADTNFAEFGVAEEDKSALVPSGRKTMEECRHTAAAEMSEEDEAFAKDYADYSGTKNGTFASGDPHYMSEEDFAGKWGTELDTRARDIAIAESGLGADMGLSDNALASGLSLEMNDDGSSFVTGREEQMGAFLANEYKRRDPVGAMDGIQSAEEYVPMAVRALETEPPAEGFDRSAYIDDRADLTKDEFNAKYGDIIMAKAKELRESDIQANAEANRSYHDTVVSSAVNAGANAALHGFFDQSADLSGNDEVGNAMMENCFTVIAADRAEGTGFRNIRIHNTPDTRNEITGKTLHGGRVVEAAYTDRNGEDRCVAVYDHAAYTSLSAEQREGLFSYRGSDGRQLWTNADIPSGGGSDSPRDSESRTDDSHKRSETHVVHETKIVRQYEEPPAASTTSRRINSKSRRPAETAEILPVNRNRRRRKKKR